MNVNAKYLKDESGNIISPVVSDSTVFNSSGKSIASTYIKSVSGSSGDSNGQIKLTVNGTSSNISVKGLGSAAYTASSSYASSSHTHSYLPLSGGTVTGSVDVKGTLTVNGGKCYLSSDGVIIANRVEFWAAGNKLFDDVNGNMFLQTGAGQPFYLRSLVNFNNYVPIVASAFTQASSIRFKKNIEDITEEEANKIDKVSVKTFHMKEQSDDDYKKAGVIAEELFEIYPNLVTFSDINGEHQIESVDYNGLTPYLIKKVQMMQKQLDKLESKL